MTYVAAIGVRARSVGVGLSGAGVRVEDVVVAVAIFVEVALVAGLLAGADVTEAFTPLAFAIADPLAVATHSDSDEFTWHVATLLVEIVGEALATVINVAVAVVVEFIVTGVDFFGQDWVLEREEFPFHTDVQPGFANAHTLGPFGAGVRAIGERATFVVLVDLSVAVVVATVAELLCWHHLGGGDVFDVPVEAGFCAGSALAHIKGFFGTGIEGFGERKLILTFVG